MTPRARTQTEDMYPFPEDRDTFWDHEYAADPHWRPRHSGRDQGIAGVEPLWDWPGRLWRTKPANEYEALMETAPGEQPRVHSEQLLSLREILVDAIDQLDDRRKFVFEHYYLRRWSLKRLATELGCTKTHVARLRDQATARLRELLSDHPDVVTYFERGTE